MKILILGGGFAGCSSAEMLSKIKGAKITLVERSGFLGAGVRTFYYGGHPYTFGPRHFLTKKKETYDYLKKFLKLRNCNYHQFKSYVEADNQFYNYPLNTNDIENMPDKTKVKKEIKKNNGKEIKANNLEEFWLKSVGPTLYDKIINNYNKKMWLVSSNKKLDTFNWSPKGYTIKKGSRAAFDDHISCYPYAEDGYNSYFDNILKIKNVKVRLKSILSKVNLKKKIAYLNNKKINFDYFINTISPDEIFNFKLGKLAFIGRDFHKIVFPVREVFPKNVFFLYYPNKESFTRLVEYKKFTRHKSKTTLVGMEIPSLNGRYYPVPIKSEQRKAKKYFDQFTEGTYSIGRAGSYRYEVDIDDCIYQSMLIKKDILQDQWNGPVMGEEFKIY
jgi:UDP-galactopyranose mutase